MEEVFILYNRQVCIKRVFILIEQYNILYMDCHGAVASVRDSHTVDLSSIPVRLVVASW